MSIGSTGTLQNQGDFRPMRARPRGKGAQREEAEGVCKLVDVTTCIGCKACEVACVEWNAYPFRETTFQQHVSDHAGLRSGTITI